MVNGARVSQIGGSRQRKIGVVCQTFVNLRTLKGFDEAGNGRRLGSQPANQFLKQVGRFLTGQIQKAAP